MSTTADPPSADAAEHLRRLKKMCLSKRAYETRSDAKRMARRTGRGSGGRRHRCDEYLCPACGRWHVTSNSSRERQRRDRMHSDA